MITDRNVLFTQIRDHIDCEVKCHRRLLDLAEAKQRTIVSGDMRAFSELLQREQEPMSAMAGLRQTRERLLHDATQTLGLGRNCLRLYQIIEQCTGQIREELRTRANELKTVCERLREINDSNMVLIRQSLGFVRDILNALVGETPSDIYDRRGGSAYARAGRGRLVNFAG
jgi:flagellar biosynthesis/type III secretory pathway chaperone